MRDCSAVSARIVCRLAAAGLLRCVLPSPKPLARRKVKTQPPHSVPPRGGKRGGNRIWENSLLTNRKKRCIIATHRRGDVFPKGWGLTSPASLRAICREILHEKMTVCQANCHFFSFFSLFCEKIPDETNIRSIRSQTIAAILSPSSRPLRAAISAKA